MLEQATPQTFRSYLYFWVGQLISLVGSSIVQFTIIWYLTITTRDAAILGYASLLGFGSTIAVSPIAGVLVDRWKRKWVIFWVDFLEAISSVVLMILFYLNIAEIWHILALLTIRGIFQGFHEPATMAIIPIMVPKEKLRMVNSYSYLFSGLIFLIGPVLGALIISGVGLNNMHLTLSIDAITFLIALIPLIMIIIPEVMVEHKEKPIFIDEFKAGINVIREKKGLFPLMMIFTAANFFLTPLFVLLPLINIESDLHGDALTLSIALALQSGGGILVSLLVSKKKLFENNAYGVFIGLVLGYIATVLVAISANFGSLIFFFIFMMLNGMTAPIANIHSQQIWQTVVPPEFQGRVFSVRRTLAQLTGPIAMGLSGIIAAFMGSLNVVIFAGILGFLFNLYIWLFTSLPKTEELLKDQVVKNETIDRAIPN